MNEKKFHLPYGLVTGLVIFALDIVAYIANNNGRWVFWTSVAALATGIVWCCLAWSKANGGNVTFGNLFGIGMRTAAIVTLVVLAGAALELFVFPDMRERDLQQIANALAEKHFPEERIDDAMEMSRRNYYTLRFAGRVSITMFFGLLSALLGAAVAPKRRQAAVPNP